MAQTTEKGGVDDDEQSFMGQEVWKDIWARLQKPEADLTIFQVPAHRVSTPRSNQEADALAKIYVLATD